MACFQGSILQALREQQGVSCSTRCGCQCPALFWNTVTPALVVPAHVVNLAAAGFKSLSSLFDLQRFSVWACTSVYIIPHKLKMQPQQTRCVSVCVSGFAHRTCSTFLNTKTSSRTHWSDVHWMQHSAIPKQI